MSGDRSFSGRQISTFSFTGRRKITGRPVGKKLVELREETKIFEKSDAHYEFYMSNISSVYESFPTSCESARASIMKPF